MNKYTLLDNVMLVEWARLDCHPMLPTFTIAVNNMCCFVRQRRRSNNALPNILKRKWNDKGSNGHW